MSRIPIEFGSGPLYSTFQGDPDFNNLVVLFVEEMPGRTASLTESLKENDWSALRRIAHQLKGAAGGYGFDPITLAAGKLELAIRQSLPEEEIRADAERLIELCSRATAQ